MANRRQQQDAAADQPLLPPATTPPASTSRWPTLLAALCVCAYFTFAVASFYCVMDDQIGGEKSGSRILDAAYFAAVTMTTVGYGDLVPKSTAAKLLVCVCVFAGMAVVALFLSKAADYLVEKQELLLVSAFLGDVDAEKTKHKLYTSAAMLAVLAAAGVVFLTTAEGMDSVDAFYCVCATVTTLGYGDVSFATAKGRAFAAAWIVASTLCVGQVLFYLTEVSAERRQRALARWVLERRTTADDLERADMDGDAAVSRAEFVVYKLKEMGKISQEDVDAVLRGFESVDVDCSGSLTVRDLQLAGDSAGAAAAQ